MFMHKKAIVHYNRYVPVYPALMLST